MSIALKQSLDFEEEIQLDHSKIKAIIIDDNEINIKVLSGLLEKHGVSCECYIDPEEGLRKILTEKYDIAFLDIMMPVISGIDILNEVRKDVSRFDMPIIMVTAKNEPHDIAEALKLGANDFIAKPIDFTIGWARIESQLIVSEYKKKYEGEKHQKIEMARLNTLVEMASSVAHEINNPMAIISGRIQLFLSQIQNEKLDINNLKTGLESISKTVDRVSGVVKNLRYFASEQSNQIKDKVSLKKIIDTTISLARSELDKFSIELKVPDLIENDIIIYVNPGQISQVLFNLVRNSIAAVSEINNGEISFNIEEKDDHVQILVIDNGKGIDTEIEQKIFDPFFSTRRLGEGLGMGLSIAKNLIEENYGTIVYHSEKGKTCFTIILPKAS